jgi:hypothetical protein
LQHLDLHVDAEVEGVRDGVERELEGVAVVADLVPAERIEPE